MSLFGLLAAFGGGVVGTAFGALIAFSFVGAFGLIGIAILAAGGTVDWNGLVTFGPIWAPSVGGFAAGAAAAAFLGAKGKLKKGNDIVTPVFSTGSAEALLVGGVFGIVGYVILWLLGQVGIAPWTDGIALTVFLSAAIVRLVWGKTGLLGKVPAGEDRFGALKTNPLLKVAIGLGAGLFSVALLNAIGADKGGVVAGFCISATSLFLLQGGFGVPVTHHM
ncbi:MAG: permease, partial [Chloroflexi bacterium]|nr:permease [Chloroflexota bacterium]